MKIISYTYTVLACNVPWVALLLTPIIKSLTWRVWYWYWYICVPIYNNNNLYKCTLYTNCFKRMKIISYTYSVLACNVPWVALLLPPIIKSLTWRVWYWYWYWYICDAMKVWQELGTRGSLTDNNRDRIGEIIIHTKSRIWNVLYS